MDFTFRQLDVYGVKVPSELAVAAVIEDVDDESFKEIMQESNKWVNTHNHIINPVILSPGTLYFELSKLFEERLKIIESVEKRLNLSAKYYIKSEVVSSWHVSFRGVNKPSDPQKSGRIAKKVSKGFKGGKFNEKNNILYPRIDITKLTQSEGSILQRQLASELDEAADYVHKFNVAFLSLANQLHEIGELYVQARKIEKKLHGITNTYKSDIDRRYLYKCPSCSVMKRVDRGVRVPKNCGSGECDKAYSAAATKRNREQPSATNKIINPTPFVKMDNTRRVCQGANCGKRKIVNNKHRCKPCHKTGL